MQIYKFGGTSLGNADNLRAVKNIVDDGRQKIIVLSANGKVTDHLVSIMNHLDTKNFGAAFSEKEKLYQYYLTLTEELFKDSETLAAVQHYIYIALIDIQSKFDQVISARDRNQIISKGEIISTNLCSMFFDKQSISNTRLFAPDIVVKAADGQVDHNLTYRNMKQWLLENNQPTLIITQGFICSDHHGNIDNLGRGGSDYSASIFGQITNASLIQIWSDVDGFLNNDPACVSNTSPLEHLSFDEAAELAYFGARILHPTTLLPAKQARIPVLLKNTLNPKAKGTIISDIKQEGGIKAIAAKDNITSITIHSGRMLLAYGFLKKIFEVFETNQTPVDMVTTSEVSVSVTIDNTERLENILSELLKMGEVDYSTDQSIICVVGDSLTEKQGYVASIFSKIDGIPIGMISYGAAKNSITFLVDTNNKIEVLQSLQTLLPAFSTKTLQHA